MRSGRRGKDGRRMVEVWHGVSYLSLSIAAKPGASECGHVLIAGYIERQYASNDGTLPISNTNKHVVIEVYN